MEKLRALLTGGDEFEQLLRRCQTLADRLEKGIPVLQLNDNLPQTFRNRAKVVVRWRKRRFFSQHEASFGQLMDALEDAEKQLRLNMASAVEQRSADKRRCLGLAREVGKDTEILGNHLGGADNLEKYLRESVDSLTGELEHVRAMMSFEQEVKRQKKMEAIRAGHEAFRPQNPGWGGIDEHPQTHHQQQQQQGDNMDGPTPVSAAAPGYGTGSAGSMVTNGRLPGDAADEQGRAERADSVAEAIERNLAVANNDIAQVLEMREAELRKLRAQFVESLSELLETREGNTLRHEHMVGLVRLLEKISEYVRDDKAVSSEEEYTAATGALGPAAEAERRLSNSSPLAERISSIPRKLSLTMNVRPRRPGTRTVATPTSASPTLSSSIDSPGCASTTDSAEAAAATGAGDTVSGDDGSTATHNGTTPATEAADVLAISVSNCDEPVNSGGRPASAPDSVDSASYSTADEEEPWHISSRSSGSNSPKSPRLSDSSIGSNGPTLGQRVMGIARKMSFRRERREDASADESSGRASAPELGTSATMTPDHPETAEQVPSSAPSGSGLYSHGDDDNSNSSNNSSSANHGSASADVSNATENEPDLGVGTGLSEADMGQDDGADEAADTDGHSAGDDHAEEHKKRGDDSRKAKQGSRGSMGSSMDSDKESGGESTAATGRTRSTTAERDRARRDAAHEKMRSQQRRHLRKKAKNAVQLRRSERQALASCDPAVEPLFPDLVEAYKVIAAVVKGGRHALELNRKLVQLMEVRERLREHSTRLAAEISTAEEEHQSETSPPAPAEGEEGDAAMEANVAEEVETMMSDLEESVQRISAMVASSDAARLQREQNTDTNTDADVDADAVGSPASSRTNSRAEAGDGDGTAYAAALGADAMPPTVDA